MRTVKTSAYQGHGKTKCGPQLRRCALESRWTSPLPWPSLALLPPRLRVSLYIRLSLPSFLSLLPRRFSICVLSVYVLSRSLPSSMYPFPSDVISPSRSSALSLCVSTYVFHVLFLPRASTIPECAMLEASMHAKSGFTPKSIPHALRCIEPLARTFIISPRDVPNLFVTRDRMCALMFTPSLSVFAHITLTQSQCQPHSSTFSSSSLLNAAHRAPPPRPVPNGSKRRSHPHP